MYLFTKSYFLNLWKVVHRSVHLDFSPNSKLSKKIWDRYRKLRVSNCKFQVTYVWIDGTGKNLRCKTKSMDFAPNNHKECPNWSCDGQSTSFTDKSSDIILCPVALYNDPITQYSNKIALCETYTDNGKPTKTNHRHKCSETLSKVCDLEPMFGFEQIFHFLDVNDKPFGWPVMVGEPWPPGYYYCSVGADKVYGREIIECLYKCLLYCGVEIAGEHPDGPSQWEIQLGPTAGIRASDDLWITRYLLQRIAEDFGVVVSINPKLYPHWHKSKCKTNFSTKQMREDGGFKFIEDALKKLEKSHGENMKAYDPEGVRCGEVEKFTHGVGERHASVRVSKKVEQEKKGYLEDRRPLADSDPYVITTTLLSSLCLDK